jgi:hypothetical protein
MPDHKGVGYLKRRDIERNDMEIKEFGTCYILVNDDGKPSSEPFPTMEQAETCKAEWELSSELESSLLDAITEWAERKAAELGMTRSQVMARVVNVHLTDYAWPEG